MTKIPTNEVQHSAPSNRWAIILAGGDGVRLRSLTKTLSGDDRPKQFSPLLGGHTLLEQTRRRIVRGIASDKTVFVLAEAHQRFFARELGDVPQRQKVVQSINKGTLPAILWGLLRVARYDPAARVALFPSDHYYSDEEKFMAGVSSAFNSVESDSSPVILLGAAATHPETEYGWIEPGLIIAQQAKSKLMRVRHFWEKPSHQIATSLLEAGCLWNTFVMVGSVRAFLDMIRKARPSLFHAFEPLLSLSSVEMEDTFMRRVYQQLSSTDFSKEVLSVSTETLAVANLRDSGWSDMGDPRRLITTLHDRGIENPWVDAGTCNQCGVTLGGC